MINSLNDTICAISTPLGIGGISIVRVSGDNAIPLLKKIFPNLPQNFESHKLYYGFITDNFNGKIMDEVLVSVMKAPKTYTREDIVEINCHGGYIVAQEILTLLVKNGARIAEPGEFTKRAFLNGRIDLSQAEATLEVITAKTKKAYELSEKNLKGNLKTKVNELKEIIIDILSELESSIDFFDDADFFNYEDTIKKLEKIIKNVDNILNSFYITRKYYQGINIVILGPPNAGKSSLLNFLLKKERAIISNIPGTTRDTIEEEIFINDIPVKVIDTAGIRETTDDIEAEGVKRALEKLEQSDIVVFLYDIKKGLTDFDKNFLEKISDKNIIIAANKVDLLETNAKKPSYLSISVKKNINLDKLESIISEKVHETDRFSDDEAVITNLRQLKIFESFKEKLLNAMKSLKGGNPLDMISFDLNEAVEELEKITGEITSEDILDRVFSTFCIGK